MQLNSARRHMRGRSPRGFSMIEVLITIVVITVALLGAAKMQAAAVSNTQVARVRSLISLQAGSLASAADQSCRAPWSEWVGSRVSGTAEAGACAAAAERPTVSGSKRRWPS